ncbi:hypothetical protein HMI54_001485 [Coelomomyces lativittatus]|nr:hypothetical protein HMI55_003340 [Coelomomyces lativittatus]KAJ1510117.1 hypothetical protein HMI56_006489 [Coelomomyces lativittatus]KAJ1510544.1 hypothetical protein HMI54_001485 [Coelomomyces lativittatus]
MVMHSLRRSTYGVLFPGFAFLFLLLVVLLLLSQPCHTAAAEYKYSETKKIAFMGVLNDNDEVHMALCMNYEKGWVSVGVGAGMNNASVWMVATNGSQFLRLSGITNMTQAPYFDTISQSQLKFNNTPPKYLTKVEPGYKCYHLMFPLKQTLPSLRPTFEVKSNLNCLYAYYEGELNLQTLTASSHPTTLPGHAEAKTFVYDFKKIDDEMKQSASGLPVRLQVRLDKGVFQWILKLGLVFGSAWVFFL